jgi:D-cysteine desulfhydrase/L-cysteate sulfo-lyase
VLAQRLLNAGFAMHGVTATSEFDVPSRTADIANQAARALGLDLAIAPADVVNFAGFVGERYGVPTPEGNEAVRLFARHEGIVLDPVYTGKCAAGMIAHVREGRFAPGDIVVFVHTGGTPAIFTWNTLWLDAGA